MFLTVSEKNTKFMSKNKKLKICLLLDPSNDFYKFSQQCRAEIQKCTVLKTATVLPRSRKRGISNTGLGSNPGWTHSSASKCFPISKVRLAMMTSNSNGEN